MVSQKKTPKWDPGWKAVQDAKQALKAKKLGEEAKRAAKDAAIGKKFQDAVAHACQVCVWSVQASV